MDRKRRNSSSNQEHPSGYLNPFRRIRAKPTSLVHQNRGIRGEKPRIAAEIEPGLKRVAADSSKEGEDAVLWREEGLRRVEVVVCSTPYPCSSSSDYEVNPRSPVAAAAQKPTVDGLSQLFTSVYSVIANLQRMHERSKRLDI